MFKISISVFASLTLFVVGAQPLPHSEEKVTFADHLSAVDAVGFSHDGVWAVTGSGGTITTWDLAKEKWFYKIIVRSGGVASLLFLPDNQRLVAAGRDKHIRIWTIDTSTPEAEIPVDVEMDDGVMAMALTKDGALLAARTFLNVIHLIDMKTKKVTDVLKVHEPGTKGGRNSLAFSPDEKFLASAGGLENTTIILDVREKKVLHRLTGGRDSTMPYVAWSHDGKMLATGGSGRDIFLWDPAAGSLLTRLRVGSSARFAFSPTDDVLAVATSVRPFPILFYRTDTEDFKELKDVTFGALTPRHGHHKGVECLAFSPNGKLLITGSSDKTAKIWEVPTK